MTQLSNLIEQLKAAEQNKSGMFEIGEDTICALMEHLLAVEGQAPVAMRWRWKDDGLNEAGEWIYHPPKYFEQLNATDSRMCELLYAAPQPAPVAQPVQVPDEAQFRELFEKWCPVNIERNKWHPEQYAHLPARQLWEAWKACRAAMLAAVPQEQQ